MVLRNCSLQAAALAFAGKKIIPFGGGTWFNFLQYTELSALNDAFAYAIDNKPKSDALSFCGRSLPLKKTEALLTEKDAVILLTSPVHMYDMYMQLCDMSLDESLVCYAFPFMQKVSASNTYRIPKIIHSFWFSGEEKPELYQRCVDSWKKYAPDYKIIEWNKDNYDYKKNAFCQKAIELGAWAYASDFARLDVVNEFGGIYLDMDVELLKPLDDLLQNKAFFSFANNISVDLAIFGSVQNNEFLQQLKTLYDPPALPETRNGFSAFFQPSFVAKSFYEKGLKFNGALQVIDDMLFLPRNYLMPLEVVTFELDGKDERTHCIHYDNFGWSPAGTNNRDKKKTDNKKLWEMIRE